MSKWYQRRGPPLVSPFVDTSWLNEQLPWDTVPISNIAPETTEAPLEDLSLEPQPQSLVDHFNEEFWQIHGRETLIRLAEDEDEFQM